MRALRAPAETASRRRGGALRHPLHRLRAVVDVWTGPREVTCEIFTGHRGDRGTRDRRGPGCAGTASSRRRSPTSSSGTSGRAWSSSTWAPSTATTPSSPPWPGAGRDRRGLRAGPAQLPPPVRNVAGTSAIVAENVAVAARSGTVELQDFGRPVHSARLNTTLATARVPPEERRGLRGLTYEVPATSIDDYVASTGLVPDFVKIDAEGAEPRHPPRHAGLSPPGGPECSRSRRATTSGWTRPGQRPRSGSSRTSATGAWSTAASCDRTAAASATSTTTSSSSRTGGVPCPPRKGA